MYDFFLFDQLLCQLENINIVDFNSNLVEHSVGQQTNVKLPNVSYVRIADILQIPKYGSYCSVKPRGCYKDQLIQRYDGMNKEKILDCVSQYSALYKPRQCNDDHCFCVDTEDGDIVEGVKIKKDSDYDCLGK